MNFSRIVGKSFRRGCCCSTFPKEKFCNKLFFWRKKKSLSDSCGSFFSIFSRIFLSSSSKLYSRCREVHFSWKSLPMEKTDCFFKFGPSTFFCIFEDFFDRFTKIAFVVSMGTFWRGNVFFFGNFFFSFSEFDRSYFELSYKHFLSVWLNLHSKHPEERFDQNKYFTKQRNVPPLFGLSFFSKNMY